MQTRIALHGATELLELLKQLPDKVQKRCLHKALRKGADLILGQIGQRAARLNRSKPHTGDLIESLGMRVKSYQKGANYLIVVGPQWPKGAHGWLVEHGHRMVTGGTVTGLDGRLAGIEKKSRTLSWRTYLGTRSTYRDKTKRLWRYLAGLTENGRLTADVMQSKKFSNALDRLRRHMRIADATGQISHFMHGAIATGGLHQKASGERGHGKVVGAVPGYPFVAPALDATKNTALAIVRGEILIAINNEAGRLARELKSIGAK